MTIRIRTLPGRAERVELLNARGRAVSWLTLVERRIYLAGRPVRTSGIGGVFTEPRYRRRGLMRRVVAAALERMRARRFPLSALFGITNFYDRFGFATVMFVEPDLRLYPNSRATRRVLSRVRTCRAEDRENFLALYRACAGGRTGACARGVTWPWKRRKGWRRVERAILAERDGRVTGYAFVNLERKPAPIAWREASLRFDTPSELAKGSVDIVEIEGRDADAIEALVRWCFRLAKRKNRGYVRLHVMPAHPAGALVRCLGGRVYLAASRAGGPMARVVDQGALLRAMAPGLAKRLKDAGARLPTGGLAIKTDLGSHTILAARGALRVEEGARQGAARIALDPSRLAQLAFGYRTAAELARADEARLSARARAACAALFPLQPDAHMSWADHF